MIINDENKVNNSKVNNKASQDKTIIYHQILDKFKAKIIPEISVLKDNIKKENEKSIKNFGEIDILGESLKNGNEGLIKKLNEIEIKNNNLKNELKTKDKDIEELGQKIDKLNSSEEIINLKFQISINGTKNENSFDVKADTKFFEIISKLYDSCPQINDMNIKGFCILGKESIKLDEFKTIKENQLDNNTIITNII